jgi:hypothetical protein
MNFGVSQSKAGEVVEKHRESGEAVKVADKPIVPKQSASVLANGVKKSYGMDRCVHVGRKRAN